MTNNVQALPFNPFACGPEAKLPKNSEQLEIHYSMVPYSADGLDLMAQEMDWSDLELETLHKAAQFIRWTSITHKIPESEAIRHRLNPKHGLTLFFKLGSEAADEKEA